MSSLDQRIRSEFQAHANSVPPGSETELLERATQRLRERRRRQRVGRQIAVSGVALLVVVGIIVGFSLSSTPSSRVTKPGRPVHAIHDPRAGKGGFTVSPSTGLQDNQKVLIRIHGLDPHKDISAYMCLGKPHGINEARNECLVNTRIDTETNAQGAAQLTFTVHRFLTIGWYYPLDCSTYAQGCSIGVGDVADLLSGGTTGNIEPVTFAPSPAPPSPANPRSLSISPAGPYNDGEQVQVNGAGFPPNVAVEVAECPTSWECTGWNIVQSSSTGTFAVTLTMQRILSAISNPGTVTADCSEPLRCYFVGQTAKEPGVPYTYVYAPGVPISFVPS
jgi:Neocarzinostatin family